MGMEMDLVSVMNDKEVSRIAKLIINIIVNKEY